MYQKKLTQAQLNHIACYSDFNQIVLVAHAPDSVLNHISATVWIFTIHVDFFPTDHKVHLDCWWKTTQARIASCEIESNTWVNPRKG